MRLLLKSFVFSIFYLKVGVKNYIPLLVYLIISQFIIIYTENIIISILLHLIYLILSSPISINIFRCILLSNQLIDNYIYFINQSFTSIYIKKILHLLLVMVGIYLIHIIILFPFFQKDFSKSLIFLYILLIYLLYIYTRLVFILPEAAIGNEKKIKDSYILTQGKSLKIYFLYISIIIPYFLINIVFFEIITKYGFDKIFLIFLVLLQLFFTIINSAIIAYIYQGLKKITA